MTEKRFYLDENGINDREYEFSVLGEDELVEIINELNDENKKLKQVNEMLQMDFAMTERNLIEENEQLKKENLELKLIIQQDEFAKEEGYK